MKQPTNNYKKAILAFTTGFINYRNCISTETKRLFIAITMLALLSPVAQAETLFTNGNINVASSWTNGLPASGNIGTIAVDGWSGSSTFGFGSGSVVNQSAVTITSSGNNGFNLTSGTWNIFGGRIVTRFLLSNGNNTIINLNGGSVALSNTANAQHMGVANGGKLNISGSATLDGTNATTVVQTGGTIDITSDWTGSWYWNPYSGNEWQDHFTSGQITLDGSTIDATAFSLAFLVSDGGKRLNRMNTTTFTGGDVLQTGNWTNGLPASGKLGNIAVDGWNGISTFSFGGGSVINQSAGTITSPGSEGFNLMKGTWNLFGGKIVTRFFLANGANTIINLSGGSVELADTTGTQYVGGANGGKLNISGSTFIDGTHASEGLPTGGAIDIASDWTGSWLWGTYSGSEWQDHFTSGQITLDGNVIDSAKFNSFFRVSNGGKTLSIDTSHGTIILIQ